MPRPPISPKIEWSDVFSSGLSYEAWIKTGESQENIEKIEKIRSNLILEKQTEGFLKSIDKPVNILIIAEDWCGDVVRHVPVLQKIIDLSPRLNGTYLTRNHNPEVFSRFLTNGGEAIPKFIFFNRDFIECGNWGPMPNLCREIIARGKACGDVKSARKKVASLYEIDNNYRFVIQEILHLIDIASCNFP